MDQYLRWLSYAAVAMVIIICVLVLVYIARYIARIWWLYKRKLTYLELTPPAFLDKNPLGTAQLFSVIHSFGDGGSLVNRLLGRKSSFSLEIVATRKEGIRYVLCVPAADITHFHQSITSYLPEVKVREIGDSLPAKLSEQGTKVISFKQAKHFAFPLASHETLELHDPIAYLTGAMTKLKSDEHMSFQLVLTQVQSNEASIIAHKTLGNEDILAHLSGKTTSRTHKIFSTINSLLFVVLDTISSLWHGPSSSGYSSDQKDAHDKMQIAMRIKPARTLSSFEQTLVESINDKVQQPLYRVSIRALVSVDTKAEAKQRVKAVRASMASFKVPKYQSLKPIKQYFGKLSRKSRLFVYTKHLPSFFSASDSLLSASEIAALYHFGHSATAKTENVVKSLSRTLPAPVSLKNENKMDIILGENHHHGSTTPIGLTAGERERHAYIIGGTGNGKTTMLLYAITQDIKAGKGIAVIDPHGDLAETILRHIPEERIKDVIYLNPDDLTHPIGINLLELDSGLAGDDLLREKDLVTESTISVLRKIFSDDDTGGHRIEYVLRNAIQTALTIEGSTLFTIFRLLNDAKYRRGIVKTLEDQDLKNFWNNELGKAGQFQKVKMSAGITAKIGRFLFSASAKRMLEQEKSTIDFEDILHSSKILICNFSKGLLGEDTSTLFGTTVLAKLQVATLRRARLTQTKRSPFYLYVDEFQNFATMSFVQMLSEARKYKLFLTMAEQSTSQQDQQRLVDIILANVGTVICFRSGSPADERFVLPLFSPYINQGEIANLPAYNFYARIAAIHAQEPMSGMTVLLGSSGSANLSRRAIEESRSSYAITVSQPPQVPTPAHSTAKPMIKKPKRSKPTLKTASYKVVGPM
jgi:hypothetical protein